MDVPQSKSEQELYFELSCYTLERRDPSFIHQYVVDAYAAQNATEATKPIGLTFALVGLYLHHERQYSGKQVQQAHMKLARRKRPWPVFDLPTERGAIRVRDVIAAKPGPERDQAIRNWSASVWQAWSASRAKVAELVRAELEPMG